MTIEAINKLPLDQQTAAFFEWFTEWACDGDRVECVYNDDLGNKNYVVFDGTGQPRYMFAETCGVIVNEMYLKKYRPQK